MIKTTMKSRPIRPFLYYRHNSSLVVIAAIVTGILLGRNVKKVEVPNFVGKNYIDDIMSNAEYNSNFKFETESYIAPLQSPAPYKTDSGCRNKAS